MNSLELKGLLQKMETLFRIEKELSAEIKKAQEEDIEIRQELEKINIKINNIQQQLDLLTNGGLLMGAGRSYKDYTPAQLYKIKQNMSWSKMADMLGCSISTCQRLVREYKEDLIDF